MDLGSRKVCAASNVGVSMKADDSFGNESNLGLPADSVDDGSMGLSMGMGLDLSFGFGLGFGMGLGMYGYKVRICVCFYF